MNETPFTVLGTKHINDKKINTRQNLLLRWIKTIQELRDGLCFGLYMRNTVKT